MGQLLEAPAKGTATKASDTQYEVLRAALAGLKCQCRGDDCTAYIRRGALEDGHAPITTLIAMAKRGFVRLDKVKHKIVGAWMLPAGRRRFEELAAQRVERAHIERRIAGNN